MGRPGHVRYKVVGMAVLLAMVTYLDRVCISKLAPNIMEEMSLSCLANLRHFFGGELDRISRVEAG
jgi:hypothetical protein